MSRKMDLIYEAFCPTRPRVTKILLICNVESTLPRTVSQCETAHTAKTVVKIDIREVLTVKCCPCAAASAQGRATEQSMQDLACQKGC